MMQVDGAVEALIGMLKWQMEIAEQERMKAAAATRSSERASRTIVEQGRVLKHMFEILRQNFTIQELADEGVHLEVCGHCGRVVHGCIDDVPFGIDEHILDCPNKIDY